MKQHELTDEQIKWGKSNIFEWSDLPEAGRRIFKAVGSRNCILVETPPVPVYEFSKLMDEDIAIFQIHPDYQRPEPEEILEKEVVWGSEPSIVVDREGAFQTEVVPTIGLRHIENGHVYRLVKFEFATGASYECPVIGDGTKATHAVFRIMRDEEVPK